MVLEGDMISTQISGAAVAAISGTLLILFYRVNCIMLYQPIHLAIAAIALLTSRI